MTVIAICVLEILNEAVTEQNVSQCHVDFLPWNPADLCYIYITFMFVSCTYFRWLLTFWLLLDSQFVVFIYLFIF